MTPVVTMIARRDRAGRANWITTRRPDWVDRLRERGESLGRLVGDPGVHTGNCARQLVVENPRERGRYVDVLEGSNLRRVVVLGNVRWLKRPKRQHDASNAWLASRTHRK